MRFKLWKAILASSTIAVVAVALPAAASATTVWVSNAAPSRPYNTCAHPAYSHIQQAIEAPTTAIHVCGTSYGTGIYEEQLKIEHAVTITGYEDATVKVPGSPTNGTTSCDLASESASGFPDQDEVAICGGSGKVIIKALNIDAVWPGEPVAGLSCGYNLNGILVAGGADLELTASSVDGAAPKAINGCQYGVGIQIGTSYTTPVSVGTATLSKDIISGYQKNGITVEGSGSEATIGTVTVTGAGLIEAIGQNGIGVQLGAKATIKKATVSGNECENSTCGSDALTQYAADGVYFYEAAAGSSIVGASIIKENDVGVESYDTPTTGPVISSDKIENSRYVAVGISQGSATIDSDTLTGGLVGIELVQFEESGPFDFSQSSGPGGEAKDDTISGMTEWAVLGRSDKNLSDLPGEFSIESSKISKNPPSAKKPLESVHSESESLKIYAEKDK